MQSRAMWLAAQHIESSTDGGHAVGETNQPGASGQVRSADTIGRDVNGGPARTAVNVDADALPFGVLDSVGDCLGSNEVECHLQFRLDAVKVASDLNRDRTPIGERTDRRHQAGLRQDGRMDAASQTPELVQGLSKRLNTVLEQVRGF